MPLPTMPQRCGAALQATLQYLDTHALHVDGLYMVQPSSAARVDALVARLVAGEASQQLLDSQPDPHIITAAVKRVLRAHEPLVPYAQHDAFVAAARLDVLHTELGDRAMTDEEWEPLVAALPAGNRVVLRAVLEHLQARPSARGSQTTLARRGNPRARSLTPPPVSQRVADHAQTNMTHHVLATVVGFALVRSRETDAAAVAPPDDGSSVISLQSQARFRRRAPSRRASETARSLLPGATAAEPRGGLPRAAHALPAGRRL